MNGSLATNGAEVVEDGPAAIDCHCPDAAALRDEIIDLQRRDQAAGTSEKSAFG